MPERERDPQEVLRQANEQLVVGALAAEEAAEREKRLRADLQAQAEQLRLLAGELQQRQELLDAVLSATPDNLYVYDWAGRYTYVSPAAAAALGLRPDDIIGKTWRELGFPASIMEPLEAQVRGVFATGSPVAGETPFPTVNGERQFHYTLTPMRSGGGAVDGVLATSRDVTEHNRTEQALREAKDYAESLIQTSSVMIIGLDTAGNITVFNEAAEKLTGYSREELAGRNWFDVLVPRDRYPQVWKEFSAAMSGGELPAIFENPILTKNGEERFISWRNTVLRDGGRVSGTISFGIDLTERHELDRLKDQFIALAAHELKTPLTLVKGSAQMLLHDQAESDPRRRRLIEGINTGTTRMGAIVDDLLDVSRLTAGGLDLHLEPVDLPAMAQAAVDQVALTTEKHHLRVVRADPVVVHGDRERLQKVLCQLVENAIKYSPQGGDVDVAVSVAGDQAVVSVTDCGLGIPKGKQAHIFERFYSAHAGTPYDYGGMAVGLFIANEIVKRHGGRMWFKSQEGKGSTFSFALPLRG